MASTSELDELRSRWLTGLPDAPEAAAVASFEDLVARHGEPQRSYHTIDHVAAVLAALDELSPTGSAPVTVELAAWLHDAVYDPTASDNEPESAALARSVLPALGVTGEAVDEICRLILLTREHRPAPGDRDGATLIDADLAILGAPAEDYDRYVREVRAEHRHVDEPAWRIGRGSVLERFLQRPALYSTQRGRARWEQPARTNLARELRALR